MNSLPNSTDFQLEKVTVIVLHRQLPKPFDGFKKCRASHCNFIFIIHQE
jgi:hypothetical protein